MGKVYCIKTYEVPEAAKTSRGRAIVNLLNLEEGEKVSAVIPLEERTTGNLIMATRNGMIKKTDLRHFQKIRKVGKIAISLLDGDQLISVQKTSGRDEILVASFEGKCIRFSEEDVRQMGRDTTGVKSIKLGPKDYVVDMTAIKDDYQILTISENGYGKRSDIEDYRLQSRAGKGIKAGVFNSKTGNLVNLKQVKEDDDLMVIADNGTVIRMSAKEISKIGRDTQGVRIMRLKNQGKVVGIAVTPPNAEEITEEEDE
jgi:DNA gyrase subunit A